MTIQVKVPTLREWLVTYFERWLGPEMAEGEYENAATELEDSFYHKLELGEVVSQYHDDILRILRP